VRGSPRVYRRGRVFFRRITHNILVSVIPLSFTSARAGVVFVVVRDELFTGRVVPSWSYRNEPSTADMDLYFLWLPPTPLGYGSETTAAAVATAVADRETGGG
jgi:hypothetical protein